MAQYQITVDSDLLHQLFLKNSQDAGVASLLEAVLNKCCKLKPPNNSTQNLTSGPKTVKVTATALIPSANNSVGTITLRVPRLRNGKFSTELFARYQRSEQALVLALMEMVVNGFPPESRTDYGRTLRCGVFQIHCFRIVQAADPL